MSRIERAVIRELRDQGITVLDRKQWGSQHRALYQRRRITRRFVGPADHFFAHITVTFDDGELMGDFKADCREVERIGYNRFGTGCSYNWMVDKDTGAIAAGMPHDAAGAHTVNDKNVPGFPNNLNYWGHAIAWVGRPSDRISQAALDSYAAIIAAEKKHGAAKLGARLYPHSKFAWKDCPCDQVRDEIPAIERNALTILEADMPSVLDIMRHRITNRQRNKTVAEALRSSLDTEALVRDIKTTVGRIEDKVDQLATGGVDAKALATDVVEQIADRLDDAGK